MLEGQQLSIGQEFQCDHLNVRVTFPTKFITELDTNNTEKVQYIAKKLQKQYEKSNRKKISRISCVKQSQHLSCIKRVSHIQNINISRLQQKEVFKTKRGKHLLQEIQANIRNRNSGYSSAQQTKQNQQYLSIQKKASKDLSNQKRTSDLTHDSRQIIDTFNAVKGHSRFKQLKSRTSL